MQLPKKFKPPKKGEAGEVGDHNGYCADNPTEAHSNPRESRISFSKKLEGHSD